MIGGVMIDPITQSYLDFLVADRSDHYDDVIELREYTNGEHDTTLNPDQIALLNSNPNYIVNVCPRILTSKTDRLQVRGIPVTVRDNEVLSEELTTLVREWWDMSRMDAQQNMLHYATSRDGDGFLMVDFDAKTLRPRLTVNVAYDGESGTDILYKSSIGSDVLFAVKRWTEISETDANKTIRRKNLYYHNRVEKFVTTFTGQFEDAGWVPFTGKDGTDEPVVWLTDSGTENGNALGMPVVHLINNPDDSNYGRSDLADVIPSAQDTLNLAAVSVFSAAQLAGFPVNYFLGVDDTKGTYEAYPGALLTISGAQGSQVSAGQFPAAQLNQMIEVVNNMLRNIALVTDTPTALLNPTGQIAAEGTLQQQEAPLIAKVKRNMTVWGNAYEDAVRLMLKYEAVYGNRVSLSLEEIDALTIHCEWEPPETRNELMEIQRIALMVEKLKIPLPKAWEMAGFTPDEVSAMKEERDAGIQQAMGKTALAILGAAQAEQVVEEQPDNVRQLPQQQTQAEAVA